VTATETDSGPVETQRPSARLRRDSAMIERPVDLRRATGSGPVVWLAIIGATCLLLFLLQKVLWLVVPILLALILYYVLFPVAQWLMYRGFDRTTAAATVMAVLAAGLAALGFVFAPKLLEHMLSWQTSSMQYINGGVVFVDRTLRSLEKAWPYLANAQIADTTNERLSHLTGNADQYLRPLVMAIAGWLPSLLLAPFLAFFFLRDGGKVERMIAAAVPNAFFEKTLNLVHQVDRTTRAYFVGLMQLTLLDTLTLAVGLKIIGMPSPFVLGLLCAVLAWLPYFGSIAGGLIVVLVAATDFPSQPQMVYAAVALFLIVRGLDDFVYMPMTIGKSLHMHPAITVMMLFIGGAIAGVSGLMLVLPLLGVVMVIGGTIGRIVTDDRLMARYRHEKKLRVARASADLVI
jgi:predicted PurR-regulated permease PerM